MNTLLTLRPVVAADLNHFFEHQLDQQANWMAAFTAKDPTDKDAFLKWWAKIEADPDIVCRTIEWWDGDSAEPIIVGSLTSHAWFGDREISYWIGAPYWGKGIASAAVKLFLAELPLRPLAARVVKDNAGSLRVLEKNGFVIVGESSGYSNARQQTVEEYILQLSDDQPESAYQYPELALAGLEWMWGEGFMSPGGAEEVAAIVADLDLSGMYVLDIGCGIGGVDRELVKTHGVGRVTGIDVESPLLEKGRAMNKAAGLSEQITFQLVTPGPLPFPDNHFDAVFSKDSMIHIPDKRALYSEIWRVLKPGGIVAFSDWFGSGEPYTSEMEEWLIVVHLDFAMGTLAEAVALMRAAGFIDVDSADRNRWYAQNILEELATMQGENYARLVEALGAEFAAQRLYSSSLKQKVVEQGHLRPGHIRARKPANKTTLSTLLND